MVERADTSIPLTVEARDALREYVYAQQAKLGERTTYSDVIMDFLVMVGWLKQRKK